MVLEKTLESPFDSKEIKPVNSKENKSWIFIGRTDAEAEASILCPPDVKNWLIGKDSDPGKDLRWEKKGKTEDEMVGWHQWLNGHESEQAPGVGDGQGSLACCSILDHKKSAGWLIWAVKWIKNPLDNVEDVGCIPDWGRSLEKKIATHSSILVWEIPWTEEPGRLESMGLQRVRHDLVTKQQTYNINNTRNKRQLLLILWTFIDNINIVPDIE